MLKCNLPGYHGLPITSQALVRELSVSYLGPAEDTPTYRLQPYKGLLRDAHALPCNKKLDASLRRQVACGR